MSSTPYDPAADGTTCAIDALADLLTSGSTGLELLALLRERFSRATRTEVFHAVTLAVSLLEADRVGLLADLCAAEAAITKLRGALPGQVCAIEGSA